MSGTGEFEPFWGHRPNAVNLGPDFRFGRLSHVDQNLPQHLFERSLIAGSAGFEPFDDVIIEIANEDLAHRLDLHSLRLHKKPTTIFSALTGY